jgi:hypothetical protein
VRVGVGGAGVLALTVLAAASGRAQSPPSSALPSTSIQQPPLGFVPPFEILRTVRASGFDPLAPPLREGGVYVLRVTDFRGILMRVVVDARTGVLHEVTRIVPNPGSAEQIGMMPQGYYPPPDDRMPVDDEPDSIMGDEGPPPPSPPMPRPADNFSTGSQPPSADTLTTGSLPPPRANPPAAAFPPLPRSRPAEFASRKPADAPGSPAQSPVPAPPAAQAKAGANADAAAAPAAQAAPVAPAASKPASNVAAVAKAPPAPDLPFNN